MSRRLAFAALAAAAMLGAASSTTEAQIRTRPRADTLGARRDSVVRDSVVRDSLTRLGMRPAAIDSVLRELADSLRSRLLIEWDPEDSAMTALLKREGYTVTRYQGNSVLFRAKEREILIAGKRAVVSRDSSTLVGDTIRYNDSTQIATARGDTVILRDPNQGKDDVVALREMRYNVRTREGITYDVTTSSESGGQTWVVHSNVAAFKGDTTNNRNEFFGLHGWITSCTETRPHYHFGVSEVKMITNNVMVARNVVLYIADIPVFWLPFIFQDMRSGRRSGLIAPRFGFSELVRNNPSYRRTIEEFGYYFAISDYLDAQLTMDWRSNARSTDTDPGWIKFNGMARYRIRDRFIDGSFGASQHLLRNGSTNTALSLQHTQRFTQRTSLAANLNYVTNTVVQRNTTFNPYAAMQVISSQLNFNTGRGPFKLNIGGNQKQFPGRDEMTRDFPSLNISSQPIRVGEWLTWTPTLDARNSERLHIDQGGGDFSFRLFQRPDGSLDSSKVDRNERTSGIRFDTPLEIFGFNWRNSFSVNDVVHDFPELRVIRDVNDTSLKENRVYKRTYRTDIDWQTSFNLPALSQGRWNLTPSVQLQKIDGRSGLLVRTERTGGNFVSQGLRPAFGLSVSPTLYGFYPGFGPLARIRHAITPTVSFSYTPKADISDEFLAANGDTRVGYLGANEQNVVTLTLQTTFEGRLRAKSDTIEATQAQKMKLLSLDLSPLSYDFERARATGKTGLMTRNVDLTVRSDLLPGLDFGVGYSLFQGDPISDTAVFKPYRETLRGTLSLGAGSPLIRGLGRLLGLDMAETTTPGGPTPSPSAAPQTPASFIAGQPIAGSINRAALQVPRGQGWTFNLTYSAQRTRPPTGSNAVLLDPLAACEQFRGDPFTLDACQRQFTATSTNGNLYNETTRGGTYFITPAQSNAQTSMSFHITNNWAAQWSTTYDFERAEFASQIVSLQREMHDWDAIFAFTRAPNGNFAFNFHIALKAQPDLKFDFDRRSYPRGYTGPRQ